MNSQKFNSEFSADTAVPKLNGVSSPDALFVHLAQQIQVVPPEEFAQMSKICAGMSKICDGMSLLYEGTSSGIGANLIDFPKQLTSLLALAGTAQTNPDKADDTQLSPNHTRDQRIYELSLNPDSTWGMIASTVNQEFSDQLDPDSAQMAAKRHQVANELPPIPRRKPKGQSE